MDDRIRKLRHIVAANPDDLVSARKLELELLRIGEGVFALAFCVHLPRKFPRQVNELPNGDGYARQSITFELSDAGLKNREVISFGPVIGSDWRAVSHFAVMNSMVYGEGDVFLSGEFTAPYIPRVGDAITLRVGALTVTFA